MSFEKLGLSSPLLRALSDLGYNTPTEVQTSAIPHILKGQDVLAGAQTGTGKTAAFSLPMLHRLAASADKQGGQRRVRCLVLTPTRELAAQVQQSIREYGRHLDLRSTTIFGGVGMSPQVDALRKGVDILVATPGRLIDHLDKRTANLSGVEILILDEADRMLDMGFLPAIKRVLTSLPRQRQTLLFSATFAKEIKELAQHFMRSPIEVQVAKQNSVVATVEHLVHPVDAARKRDLLLQVLAQDTRRQTLVFSRTKHGADKLVKVLQGFGHKAAAIHGNKSQNARTRALADFKSGRLITLVATDIAARGLDIEQLPTVINFDLPMVAEDYVHRIGRTGRNGSTGLAISLVQQDESGLLRDIQKLLGMEIPRKEVEGFTPTQPLKMTGPAPKGPARGNQRAPGARPNRNNQPRSHAGAAAPKQAWGRPHTKKKNTSRSRSA